MNYIPQVAKMLGVEMGERFNVVGSKRNFAQPFYFTEMGLQNEETDDVYSTTLTTILNGKYTIKEIPWKPKKDERYFFPRVFAGVAEAMSNYWKDEPNDISRYKANFVCRTSEEAKAKAPKMLDAVKDDE